MTRSSRRGARPLPGSTTAAVLAGLLLSGFGAPDAHGAPAPSRGAVPNPEPASGPADYSPPVRDARLTNLYWGDSHLHTRNSADAFIDGNEHVTPDEAFRFAQGQEVRSQTGLRVKLRRPLDFLAVADHAEYLGVLVRVKAGDAALAAWPLAQQWRQHLERDERRPLLISWAMAAFQPRKPQTEAPQETVRSIWSDVVRTADRFNNPGHFTALVAYEWTSMNSAGDNLHRVVIYRDGGDKAAALLPFTAQDSTDPEALWRALEQYERQTNGQVLAIAHNGNLSNGSMFAPNTMAGAPLDADYARRRARWEPVYEVTQVKGDGETHPALSPTDEFANFERWDKTNIAGLAPKQPWMLQYEYARSALKEGLRYEAKLDANPFKFGLIGSTDSHTGLATTTEDNFFGKFPESEPGPQRSATEKSWEFGASGLAAVWASENTRAAIFDAFKRREVYGTSGSRIMVRFFGGWNFAPQDAERPDYVAHGYRAMSDSSICCPAASRPSTYRSQPRRSWRNT